jgi:uncharacterized protein (TIGR02271 family)
MPTSAGNNLSENSLLRSEQRLDIGSEWVGYERVRARRRIVSETVQMTVTVRREELVFDTVPMPASVVDLPIEYVPPLAITLHEEVPVITLATRPYERVTVSVVQVAGEQVVTAVLEGERVDLVADGS